MRVMNKISKLQQMVLQFILDTVQEQQIMILRLLDYPEVFSLQQE